MDTPTLIAVLVAVVALAVAAVAVLRGGRSGSDRFAETTERLAASQAELAARLSQIAETEAANQRNLGERLQAQERIITKALEDRLADVSKKVGDSLQQSSVKSSESLTRLQERLAVIDAAQKNITDLSAQVVQLQDVLTNRHARGVFACKTRHGLCCVGHRTRRHD